MAASDIKTKTAHLGLNAEQVVENRRKYGINILTPATKESPWHKFVAKFSDPLIVILMVAGILSIGIAIYEYYGLGCGLNVFFEPIGIFVAILLATGLAFIFENKAEKEFAILNQVNDNEPVKVIRSGNVIEIPKRDVVVGDVVIVNTGDEIPADGVLMESTMLSIDESSLTGEPVCHKTTVESDFDANATYPSNQLLRGTKVMEGHGIFEVTKVGDATENGSVFKEVQIDDSVKTPLNEQLDGLGHLITRLSYCIAGAIIVGRIVHFFDWALAAWSLFIPIMLFFYLVIKRFESWKRKTCISTILLFFAIFIGWVIGLHELLLPGEEITGLLAHTLSTLMIAVTLIVVAVPEGLPMAVTLSLAYSMRSMLKTNNLVRKLHACETMGATTVICTDKTGTLTQNKMQVDSCNFADIAGNKICCNNESNMLIAEAVAVNSTASLDFSNAEPTVVGNPTEGALLLWLHRNGLDYRTLRKSATTIDEMPFSTERKYMAVIVESAVKGRKMLYVKGAPEIIYSLSTASRGEMTKSSLDTLLSDYQQRAMRTLGFACREIDNNEPIATQINNLTFLGITAISDPVRNDVAQSVGECVNAGIAVKIVTGDTAGTAREIGRQIGLWTSDDTDKAIITGPEFAALSDDELLHRVTDLKIIARARPMDKKRLVEALQAKNQIVAVTGDGTNDAPALKAAHVGLSMGDGTSVAKEASDITIIDNSFASIGRAVMWGRSLYQNIQRFLLFQLTVNVSACLIVLVGAFIGTESPLTVTQMLWVNLIMDTFGAMALASLPPAKKVMTDKPRKRNAFILTHEMYWNILGVGFAFFLMLLALLYIFQHADITCMKDFLTLSLGSVGEVTLYEQTLMFSIFVWTHFWYMFNARGFKTGRSALHFKGCNGFITISLVIIIGQILIVEVMYNFFNVCPMRLDDWVIVVLLSSVVLWIREASLLFDRKK